MPNLIIIAGCNGAGKSTFASSFLPDGLSSFDYDKLFLKYYKELDDSEFRDEFAKDMTTKDIARHRIQVRTEFKGHFVDNKTIDLKWKAGYENLNNHYKFFDNILFVDNSKQNDIYTNLLQIENGEIVMMTDEIPGYFKHRFPKIYELIKKQ